MAATIKKILITVLTVYFLPGAFNILKAESHQRTLKNEIENILGKLSDSSAIYMKDLATGKEVGLNYNKPFYIASAVKLFVMVEAFRQIEAGTFSTDEMIVIRKSLYRDGAGSTNWIKPGRKVSAKRLLREMIIESDNAATDILMARLGLDNINKTARGLGLEKTEITSMLGVRHEIYRRIHPHGVLLDNMNFISLWGKSPYKKLRLFEKMIGVPKNSFTVSDYEAAFNSLYQSGLNSVSPKKLGKLLERIVDGNLISKEASKKMLDLMLTCKTGKNRIKKALPPYWKFAHKTGTQHRLIFDSGIIIPSSREPIIMIIGIRGFTGKRKSAEEKMVKVASALLKYLAEDPWQSIYRMREHSTEQKRTNVRIYK